MAIKWSPGCNCCGCTVADTNTTGGFAASGDSPLVLAAGGTATTVTTFPVAGYSLAVELGVTLEPSGTIRDITAGSVADYAGLRLEVIDEADTVLAHFELVETFEYDLNGKTFFTDSENAYFNDFVTNELVANEFYSRPDPHIQQVYESAKMELCCTEDAIQIKTWFVYEPNYFFRDAAGIRYGWQDAITRTFGVALSQPYSHPVAGSVRLRVKNAGAAEMTLTSIQALKRYDSGDSSFPDEDSYGYDYGCETTSNETNVNCDECQSVCTYLPGNRYHDATIVSHPLPRPLADPFLIQRNGCGFYAGHQYRLNERGWSWWGKVLWDFDSDVVVDPNTGESISGSITYSNGRTEVVEEDAMLTDIQYQFSGRPIELLECSAIWRVTLQIQDVVAPTGALETAAEALATKETLKTAEPMTWDGPRAYSHPNGPPPNLTGTGTSPNIGFDASDRNSVSITADIEVPLFDTCSPIIRWELVPADISVDEPRYVRILSGASVSAVIVDNAFYAKMVQNFTVLDLAGKYLEFRIC